MERTEHITKVTRQLLDIAAENLRDKWGWSRVRSGIMKNEIDKKIREKQDEIILQIMDYFTLATNVRKGRTQNSETYEALFGLLSDQSKKALGATAAGAYLTHATEGIPALQDFTPPALVAQLTQDDSDWEYANPDYQTYNVVLKGIYEKYFIILQSIYAHTADPHIDQVTGQEHNKFFTDILSHIDKSYVCDESKQNELYARHGLPPAGPLQAAATTAPQDDPARKAALTKAEEMLKNFVAQDELKQEIKDFIVTAKAISKLSDEQREKLGMSHHLVITGDSGTGKTTLGKIIALCAYGAGLTETEKFSRVVTADLVGKYVGHTENNTRDKLSEYLGGTLMIDEFQSIYADADGNDFNLKARNELVNFSEEYRDSILLILTGYHDGVQRVLNSDEGLQSRFPTQFKLHSYSNDELISIFNAQARQTGIHLSGSALPTDDLNRYFEQARQAHGKNFGNGRLVRNLLERSLKIAWRDMNTAGALDKLGEDDAAILTITPEHIRKAMAFNGKQHSDNSVDIQKAIL